MRIVSLLVPLMLAGCVLETTEAPKTPHSRPFRDQWRLELSAPMPLDGEAAIQQLLVGGQTYEGNFANRGDVIIKFHDAERIDVEMRRFTRAASTERAEEDFADLHLWAYVGGDVAPVLPSEMEFPRPCVGEGGVLRERCGLRVFFDGLTQPLRTGADLRVTLPARYAGALQVITEDSIVDADYQNRGNVCIEPTRAQVSVQLEDGVAYGSVAAEATAEQPVSLSIDGLAAEQWIDVPAQLRTRWSVGYEDDASKQERCYGEAQLHGVEYKTALFGATRSGFGGSAGPEAEPLEYDAFVNGYADTCDVVAFTEDPEAWDGDPHAQPAEVRGAIHLCNDCLRTTPCEELLAGG